MAIIVPIALVDKLRRELSARKESVYLVDGHRKNDRIVIRGFIAMANMARSSSHFLVTVSELRRATERLRFAALGVLHSHGRGCCLSVLDQQCMSENPAIWLVASVKPFEMKAFKLYRSVPKEIPILLS